MFSDRITLCDGIVASFSDEHNVYICYVPWLGRDIEVWLSAGEYNDESEIDSLKKTFEKFWSEKNKYLSAGQNDIKEKLIPYIAKKRSTDKKCYYRDISADDFDAEYWLTSIYIVSGIDGLGEVQLNFYKDGDEDSYECVFIGRDLESGYLSFYIDLDMITLEN